MYEGLLDTIEDSVNPIWITLKLSAIDALVCCLVV